VKFEVVDRGQGPSWWLYDSDELLAWPGRYYATLAFAQREAERFRAAAPQAIFEVFQAPGGWQWRAVQPYDYYLAYSPGVFDRPGQARKAGRQVRRRLQHAGKRKAMVEPAKTGG
jgi:hypothetical protein